MNLQEMVQKSDKNQENPQEIVRNWYECGYFKQLNIWGA